MYNTFNMNWYGSYSRFNDADKSLKLLSEAGEQAYIIGEVEKGERRSNPMLKLAVMVSGGGTNLQALIDEINSGALQDVSIEIVISTRSDAYALERAKKHGIPEVSIVKKDYSDQATYEDALLEMIDSYNVDLLVLAGCLAIIPPNVVRKYRNRIINIHPSLIPAFSGSGYYGLKVHE